MVSVNGVNAYNAYNAYTKAGNPYNKTNKGKKIGAIASTSYLALAGIMLKGAVKSGKVGLNLELLGYAINLLATGIGIGAIVDFVKNQTARQIADAKAEK